MIANNSFLSVVFLMPFGKNERSPKRNNNNKNGLGWLKNCRIKTEKTWTKPQKVVSEKKIINSSLYQSVPKEEEEKKKASHGLISGAVGIDPGVNRQSRMEPH